MDTTTTSSSFNEYWEDTEDSREGYPQEIVDLLKRHARNTWNSAIQSAGNNVYIALQDMDSKGKVAHDTIWNMKDREYE